MTKTISITVQKPPYAQ